MSASHLLGLQGPQQTPAYIIFNLNIFYVNFFDIIIFQVIIFDIITFDVISFDVIFELGHILNLFTFREL